MLRHIAQAFFLPFLILVASTTITAQGTPIGFAEDWALATDRAKVLEQLIPGTRDYYYYSCRHQQDTGAFDKVEPLLNGLPKELAGKASKGTAGRFDQRTRRPGPGDRAWGTRRRDVRHLVAVFFSLK